MCGVPSSAVALEIYGDFQCPSCAHTSEVIDELSKIYGAQMRVIFYEFPLEMHQHALAAAMAAEAASEQGHFWEMHDMLYRFQDVWSKATEPGKFFSAYAQSLGLDLERFNRDAQSPELKLKIMNEGNTGLARGVRNTPTIFINGTEVRGGFVREKLQAAIDQALAAGKKG